nr:hypothetical protein [bacterium]
PCTSSSTSVQLCGDGNSENFIAHAYNFQSWPFVIDPALDSSQLYQSVNFYDRLNVTWKYKVAKIGGGWGDWISMNTSSHLIYVIYSSPPYENPLYDFALDKACHYAVNEQSLSGVAGQLCVDIKTDLSFDPEDSHTGGNPLVLYDKQNQPFAMCWDHVDLMTYLARSLGIVPTPYISFAGCMDGQGCWYYYVTDDGTMMPTFQIEHGVHDEAEVNPHFGCHFYAHIDGTFYDPSYGETGLKGFIEKSPPTDSHPLTPIARISTWVPLWHPTGWTCPH